MVEGFKNWLIQLFAGLGLSGTVAEYLTQTLVIVLVITLSFLAHLITKKIVLVKLTQLTIKTKYQWDDIFLDAKVFHRLFHLAPALVLFIFSFAFPGFEEWIARVTLIYIVVVSLMVIDALLNAGNEIYRLFEISKEKPIKGYIQVVKIFLYLIGTIFVLSTLLNRSPWGFLTGLGAMTAILLLVFKDTILGLVASFQLVSNKMVRIGDWIEMPKYEADGDVIELSLNTVKVQNWDKTITTIPTYYLISDAFKNWRGMQESGGRRIKRSLSIDMDSIGFCTQEMIERFGKIHLISNYIKTKQKEVVDYNKLNAIESSDISGRQITNIGTFRAYIVEYLRNHPKIHKDMTFLVRQLAPTEKGLPIELYVFSNDQEWANYEGIQADIFDHILSAVSVFDLRLFQYPTGTSLGKLSSHG